MIRLCLSESISDGKCKEFKLDSGSFFVVRRHGVLYAYENRCPHLGTPLNWREDEFLDSDEELIQCATHGALFIIESGKCVSGPCLGMTLSRYKIVEKEGAVFLDE